MRFIRSHPLTPIHWHTVVVYDMIYPDNSEVFFDWPRSKATKLGIRKNNATEKPQSCSL